MGNAWAKPKLLYVVTEDWYFVLHWLRLARAARDSGFDVGVAVRVSKCKEPIAAADLPLFPLNYLRRSSLNPFSRPRQSRNSPVCIATGAPGSFTTWPPNR